MTVLIDNASEVQRLVKALRSHGVTPQDIARKLDVSVRTVYHWNKGDTGPREPRLMDGLSSMLSEAGHGA
ncbi:helix-turn-helix domain-containing protein [bacterium]|nr:helix-turn-helix domain-containing protein [bacterium]